MELATFKVKNEDAMTVFVLIYIFYLFFSLDQLAK
jgi:hypothetical protein